MYHANISNASLHSMPVEVSHTDFSLPLPHTQDHRLYHATLYHASSHSMPVEASPDEVAQETRSIRSVTSRHCPIQGVLERIVITNTGVIVACWQARVHLSSWRLRQGGGVGVWQERADGWQWCARGQAVRGACERAAGARCVVGMSFASRSEARKRPLSPKLRPEDARREQTQQRMRACDASLLVVHRCLLHIRACHKLVHVTFTGACHTSVLVTHWRQSHVAACYSLVHVTFTGACHTSVLVTHWCKSHISAGHTSVLSHASRLARIKVHVRGARDACRVYASLGLKVAFMRS